MTDQVASDHPARDHGHQTWTTGAALLAAGATVLATLGGLFYNASSTRLASQQAEQAVTAQTAERFSRSVDQIGSDDVAVRAGAVHALEALARDAPKNRPAVNQILASLIQVQMGATKVGRQGVCFSSRADTAPPRVRARFKEAYKPPPPPDVAAAFQSLSHLRVDRHDRWLPLSQLDVSGLNMTGYDLRGMDLTRADLSAVTLLGAQLAGTRFAQARMCLVALPSADAPTADFTDADLFDAMLLNANLRGANFTGADLGDADLRLTDLRDAKFADAQVTGTRFSGADVRGADFSGVEQLDPALFIGVKCSRTTRWPTGFDSPEDCR